MLMDYFPSSAVFDKDQSGPDGLFDCVGSCLKTVSENKGRNPNVAENIDLQALCLHRQVID